ncbi:MAG TPA: flavin reductase family protein [Gemmatimonadales bacterium]|nr:flavin reductase family protein [Gemmatimonadales bacterium]
MTARDRDSVAALFRRLTQGVYVIGVSDGERKDAFTAAWIMQASFDPLLLAISINPGNASYELLHASGWFTVNILKQGQLELARHFGTKSGRNEDKLARMRTRPGRAGSPILEDALAYFECELEGRTRAGDHELVLGRVADGRILDAKAAPLTYAETGDMDGSSALYPEEF